MKLLVAFNLFVSEDSVCALTLAGVADFGIDKILIPNNRLFSI